MQSLFLLRSELRRCCLLVRLAGSVRSAALCCRTSLRRTPGRNQRDSNPHQPTCWWRTPCLPKCNLLHGRLRGQDYRTSKPIQKFNKVERALRLPLCKSQLTSRLLCGAESGSITMFPAAMPPGWPPAPTGSRRLTDKDQVPAEMGFSSRYALLRNARYYPIEVSFRAVK